MTFLIVPEGAEVVSAPAVTPSPGTYGVLANADRFSGEKMPLAADCGTDGAEIRYTLRRSDGSGWKDVQKDAGYESGIDLDVAKGGTAFYWLEIWAARDGAESVHRNLYYTVEDDRPVDTVAVKVRRVATVRGAAEEDVAEPTVASGGDVTLVAPTWEGHSFEKWTDGADTLGTDATLTLRNVTEARTVTAVYNPVVSELDLDIAAPGAHGALAKVAKVSAKIGTSTEPTDITGYFDADGGSNVSWSPAAGPDGKAGHGTAYTATFSVADSSATGTRYLISPGVKVLCKGEAAGTAYTTGEGAGLELHVQFPATGRYVAKSLAAPKRVDLSFTQALAYHAAGSWDLPGTATLKYGCDECTETEKVDVALGDVSAFDADSPEEQEFEVTGRAGIPGYVDGAGVTGEVSLTVHVAAPETVATPTASPEPGTHRGAQEVGLECATRGATIIYTTDGSEPAEGNGTEYGGGPIEVAHSATLKARAVREGMLASEVAEFEYTIEHEVRFDAADGSDAMSAWVADGKAAERPEDPARKGYEFAGWYAEGADEAYDFETPVTAGLALFARWSAKGGDGAVEHLVTFDAAGGSAVAAQTVKDGERAEEPAAPTRSGYEFRGWTLDGSAYDFSTPVKGDLKLVASWKKKESKEDDGSRDDSGSGKEQDGSADDRKGGTTKTTTVTTVTTSLDGTLAATGDRTPLIVAALVALGLLAAAAGIISKRKEK